MQFTRVNSNPDETNGLLGVIDKVGLTDKTGCCAPPSVHLSFQTPLFNDMQKIREKS
jgi:hypothetical protein